MFSLICVWINSWVNNREAGDLGRHRSHYDVNIMLLPHTLDMICMFEHVYQDKRWQFFAMDLRLNTNNSSYKSRFYYIPTDNSFQTASTEYVSCGIWSSNDAVQETWFGIEFVFMWLQVTERKKCKDINHACHNHNVVPSSSLNKYQDFYKVFLSDWWHMIYKGNSYKTTLHDIIYF